MLAEGLVPLTIDAIVDGFSPITSANFLLDIPNAIQSTSILSPICCIVKSISEQNLHQFGQNTTQS